MGASGDIYNDSIELDGDKLNESLEKKGDRKSQRIHPVKGYSDRENMWEKVWNLEK